MKLERLLPWASILLALTISDLRGCPNIEQVRIWEGCFKAMLHYSFEIICVGRCQLSICRANLNSPSSSLIGRLFTAFPNNTWLSWTDNIRRTLQPDAKCSKDPFQSWSGTTQRWVRRNISTSSRAARAPAAGMVKRGLMLMLRTLPWSPLTFKSLCTILANNPCNLDNNKYLA